MSHRLRPKLSYANVIATIALFIALGGAATAATQLPRNSVGTKQIRNGAVNTKKLRKHAVRPNKIAPKAVTVGKLGPQAVTPGNLGNGSVKTNKIASQAVNASKIRNNVVTTNKLNTNAVTNEKLAPDSVGAGNLLANAVGPANMRINSVATETLQNGAVTAAKLSSDVGPVLGTLKSGQTLRGVFSVGSGDEGAGTAQGAVSYQFPLLTTPTVNVLKAGETSAACGGLDGANKETPLAAAGNLCIYVVEATNVTDDKPAVDYETRLGFALRADVGEAAEGFSTHGMWAVTAP